MATEGTFRFKPLVPGSDLHVVYTDIISGKMEFCGKIIRHGSGKWEAIAGCNRLGTFKTRMSAALQLVKS